MTNFWAMGGYARYVWPCFGCTALVLAWNVWAARRAYAAARRRALRAIAMAVGDGYALDGAGSEGRVPVMPGLERRP